MSKGTNTKTYFLYPIYMQISPLNFFV